MSEINFTGSLKLADVTPVFKNEDASLLKNYSPETILALVSKTYRRSMQKQILEYIDKHLSPHLCRHRKGYSTQAVVVSMLEKWSFNGFK